MSKLHQNDPFMKTAHKPQRMRSTHTHFKREASTLADLIAREGDSQKKPRVDQQTW